MEDEDLLWKDKGNLRSKRFRAAQEQRTRSESQRPREKWRE